MTGLRNGIILLLGAFLLPAQEFTELERKVTQFTLANGLQFIVMERHQVPVVSFHTFVNAGFAQDPAGQTGLAHMVERMTFKGTDSIGTHNWATEKKALDDLEAAYERREVERLKGSKADAGRLGSLDIDLKRAIDEAEAAADSGEFARVIQQNGGVGLASHTTADSIESGFSLPSNRLELWFLLESQRLTHPVFRDFYKERDALAAENTNSVETKALPKLQQTLLATAFVAHPYRNPPLGWPSDVDNLRRADAKAFFDTYYVPGNIFMGIVGDVDPATVQRLAERYFGSIPAKPIPPPLHTVEPVQLGPKSAFLGATQAVLMIGYKRPDQQNPDDLALDVIRTILAEGTGGWVNQELIEQKKLAQFVEVTATVPAGRFPALFVFTVVPAQGHTLEENQKALDEIVLRLATKPVDSATLNHVKTILRARVVRLLSNNQQVATVLPAYVAGYGDWRRLFSTVDAVNRLTPEEVQRVAAKYFIGTSRTIAVITDGQTSGSRVAQ